MKQYHILNNIIKTKMKKQQEALPGMLLTKNHYDCSLKCWVCVGFAKLNCWLFKKRERERESEVAAAICLYGGNNFCWAGFIQKRVLSN